MAAKYRVVHFVPDPFTGMRIPVAAIVFGAGGISVASAARLPGPACLGRSPSHATMRMVIDSLSTVDNLNSLPVSVGPHAVLDIERSIPGEVSDPVAWVVEHVLPQNDRPSVTRVAQSHHRGTQGFRFFETYKVAQYVRQRFQPDQHWAGSGVAVPRKLGTIWHWVGAPKVGILLMEPLIPARTGFERDLQEVYQRLASYRAFLNRGDAPEGTSQNTKLCVYVLPGGKQADRTSALGAFADVEAAAVDTESESARRTFIDEICTLGQAASPQTDLTGCRSN